MSAGTLGLWLLIGVAAGRAAALTGVLGLSLGLPLATRGLPGRPRWLPVWVALGSAAGVATAVPAAVALRLPLALAPVVLAALLLPARWWSTLRAGAGLAVLTAGAAALLGAPGHWWLGVASVVVQGILGAVAGAVANWCREGAGQGAYPPAAGALAVGALAAACGRVPGGAGLAAVMVTAYLALGPARRGGGGTLAAVACGLLPAAVFGPLVLAASAAGGAVAEATGPGAPAPALAAGNLAVSLAAIRAGWTWGAGALLGAALALAITRVGAWARRPQASLAAASSATAPPAAIVERLRLAAHQCLALSRNLAAAAEGGRPAGPMRVAEEVCPGCPALATCWERRLPRAQRMVRELYGAARRGRVHWQQVGGPETILCLRPREMAEAANRLALLDRQREAFERRSSAQRSGILPALVDLGQQLDDLAAEVAAARDGGGVPQPRPRLAPAPALRWEAAPEGGRWGYRAAGLSLARPGQAVSGDAVRCRPLGGDRLALVLADGMGSGPQAAILAAGMAEHVLACLTAGRSATDALRQANAQLLAGEGEDAFSTLDLAILHLRGGVLEWYKMGAPPSLLLRNGGMRQLSGGGLPAGILVAPAVRSGRVRLIPGDRLVLVSDGVLDGLAGTPRAGAAGGRGGWITERLGRRWAGLATPEILATGLADAVLAHADAGRHDDLAVLVCRLEGTAGGEGAATGPDTG